MRDGWHDLPGGGSVKIEGGNPVEVSDRGRRGLDENQILREASEYSNAKLTWAIFDRSRRWYRPALLQVLTGKAQLQTCSAGVLRAGCDLCASNVGVQWVQPSPDDSPIWWCGECPLSSYNE
jgi:hypothetical protein